MSQAFSEFGAAVWHLAGHGPQRERLKRACGLSMVRMRRNEVPNEVRHIFDAMRMRLNDAPTMTSTLLHHVIDGLDEHDVTATIDDMLRIFATVARYQPCEAVPSMRAPLLSDQHAP